MNPPTLARPVPLYRPWSHRIADALGAVWLRWQQSRQLRRQYDALRELDDATLRDLGAPPWLMSDARAWRDAREFDEKLRLS